MTDLSACGYGIYGNKIKFEEYNVPQTRHRLILFIIVEQLNGERSNK
jgi:site-specific DNA-cytosine methylase